MSQGITITINAETAEAAQKVTQFFAGIGENLTKMTGVGSALSEFGQRLAGLFTVGAMVEFTREAINTAEQLGKLTQKTGISLTTLSALREEANRLGTPFEELQFALGMFSDKLFQAVKVGGPALQTFRELGIQLLNADGTMRTVDQALAEVAEKFKDMPAGPQKTAAAIDLFGRSGRELIPILNQGAAGIERMRAQGGPFTPEMVRDSTEFNRAMREVKEAMELVFIALAERLLPKLKELAEWFRGMASSGLAQSLGTFGAVFAMEFTKGLTDGIIRAATFFGEAFIRVAQKVAEAIDALLVGSLNKVILWLDKNDKLARLLGGSIQTVSLSDNAGAADEQIRLMLRGAVELRQSVDEFFDKGIAAAKGIAAGTAAARDNLKAAVQFAVSMPGLLMGLLGLGSAGTAGGQKAPVSEQAKALMRDIEKAYQAATESKVGQLDAEERQLKEKIDKEVLDVTLAEQEKAKVTQLYAAKRTEVLNKEADAQMEIALARIQGQRTLLGQDPDITAADKQERLLELLRQENALLEANIELNRKRVADERLSDEAHLAAAKKLEELEQKHAQTQQAIRTTSAQGTFAGEFRHVLTGLGDQWGSWAQQTANAFKSVFESAISSISNGITGLIMGTKTWGQALMQIGTTILTSIVSAIVTMGVRWVLTQIMMATMGKAIAAAAVAATAPIAAAESAIWAGPAALATIASYGGAAAAAPGMIAIAQALTLAESVAQFAEGGFTGGSVGRIAGLVHGGEFVFSAPAVQAAGVGRLEGMHNALLGGGGGVARQKDLRVGIFDDRRRMGDYLRDPEFNTTVLHLMDGNRWRYLRQR